MIVGFLFHYCMTYLNATFNEVKHVQVGGSIYTDI